MSRKVAIVFGFVVLLSSCGPERWAPKPEIPDDNIARIDQLFVHDGVSTTTIDTEYSSGWPSDGYTLWCRDDSVPGQEFTDRTVSVTKHSGDSEAGYGFLVCRDTGAGNEDTMVTVMINTMGYYKLNTIIGKAIESLVDWRECAYLNAGYDETNKIRLTYSNEEKSYTLYFNDHEIQSFNATEPVHESALNGYIIELSEQDALNGDPVSVSFEE